MAAASASLAGFHEALAILVQFVKPSASVGATVFNVYDRVNVASSDYTTAGAAAITERDTVAVPAADPALLGAAVSRLGTERIAISQIGLRLPSLDEAFLRLTERSTR